MATIPPITSGSSQEMIHYDWEVRVLPLNLADKALMDMQARCFFKFVPKGKFI